jgi:drug/metabolite transporter (DMT)-like permease
MTPQLLRLITNIGLLLVVNICWGSQSTAYKLVGTGMGPITTSFLIYLISVPSVLPLFLKERWNGASPSVPAEERSLLRWDNLGRFLLIGVVAASTMFFMAKGMARTTAANGALLTLTIPIVTAMLAVVFICERMTLARWGSLGVALLGVMVLSVQAPESATQGGRAIDWHGLSLANKDFIIGNLLVMLGCTGSCLFNVFSKSLLSRFSLVEVLFYAYSVALVADAGMVIAFEPTSLGMLFDHSLRTWTGLLLIGAVANGLAMALWLFLLTRMDVSQASVSVYLLPFFGVLQAAIVLHEPITLPMVIGGAITLTGTILVVSADTVSRKTVQPEEAECG